MTIHTCTQYHLLFLGAWVDLSSFDRKNYENDLPWLTKVTRDELLGGGGGGGGGGGDSAPCMIAKGD